MVNRNRKSAKGRLLQVLLVLTVALTGAFYTASVAFADPDPDPGSDPVKYKVSFNLNGGSRTPRIYDSQYVVSGDETMGWSPVEGCGKATEFDAKKDCGFFSDKPMAWFPVRPGCFALFYPQDAHAPCVGEGTCRKVVIKVLA